MTGAESMVGKGTLKTPASVLARSHVGLLRDMKIAGAMSVCLVALLGSGCSGWLPTHLAPKTIIIDGTTYTACSGIVKVYSPSRGVVSSSSKTYEITFTDEFGQSQDFEQVSSYSIIENPNATYAMPDYSPSPDDERSAAELAGLGAIMLFGNNGDEGMAIFISPGKWKAVPCPDWIDNFFAWLTWRGQWRW